MKLQAFIIVASLASSPNTHADKLFTPTLWAVAPDKFACNLTNVGDRPRNVSVRIISNGKVLLDSGKLELAPQHTADQFVDGVKDGAPFYCEFSVQGSRVQYRGSAKLFHAPNSSDFVTVAAE